MDSPSRQLLDELNMRHKAGERKFKRKLDEANEDQERCHREQLAYASAEHKRVRLNAERTRERFLLEQERARQRLEQEEQRRLEHARAEVAAKERRALANQEQQERERIRQEHEDLERRRRLEEERVALEHARQQEDERLQRQKHDDERRAAEEEAAREQGRQGEAEKQQAASSQPKTNGITSGAVSTTKQKSSEVAEAGLTTTLDQRKSVHNEYLDLHKQLKNLRKTVNELGKQDKLFKNKLGDGRRAINKAVGQMNVGTSQSVKEANRKRMLDVRNVLNDARQFPRHHVDVRNFIVPSRHVQCSDSEAQISGLFIYLLNELAKIVIRQFAGDARVDPAKAEPVGLLLMMNFGFATFQWKGTPYLIDIFLAKYHKVCPALFGIYDAVPKGGTIDYAEYITGLAGGFASVTLRDFSKAQGKNPLPCSIFWKTVAMIINTPPAQVQNTHLFVLKALLHPVYVEKFIRFYGDMGISLLRRATVEFPADLDSNAATGVKVLPDQWRKEIKLIVR